MNNQPTINNSEYPTFNFLTECNNLINNKDNKRTMYEDQLGHEPVQPIRTKEQISFAQQYLLNRTERYSNQNLRDYTLFTLNINIGLRCGDLTHLKVGYVMNPDFTIKESFRIKEQKTTDSKACKNPKQARLIVLRKPVQELLLRWIHTLPQKETTERFMSQCLFPSRRTKTKKGYDPSLSKQQLWNIMQGIKSTLKEQFDIMDNIGTHSMRKTFALQMYNDIILNYPNEQYALETLCEILGHNNVSTTRKYIGITDEKKIDVWNNTGLVGEILI